MTSSTLREKIGVMFGNPGATPSAALKFYSSVRLDIRRIETLKDGTEAVGNRAASRSSRTRWRRRSSRPSSTSCTAKGVSREGTLLDLGVLYDVVTKSGAFFSYNDERLGQGRANAKVFLRENPDMADAIEAQIRAKAGLPGGAPLENGVAAPEGVDPVTGEVLPA